MPMPALHPSRGAWARQVLAAACLPAMAWLWPADAAHAQPLQALAHNTACAMEADSAFEAAAVQRELAPALAARSAQAARPPGSIVVPVYFHVVYRGSGEANGNLPQAKIDAQMAYINSVFASTPFLFELKETTRTQNRDWYEYPNLGSSNDLAMKTALRRGGKETLNIYTVLPGGGQHGYAYFPWWIDSKANGPILDGVVIDSASVPGGIDSSGYNKGHTAVHEIGHWLGLYHVSQDTQRDAASKVCSGKGDRVNDTPLSLGVAGCPKKAPDSCPNQPGRDPIHNFMTYTDDGCTSEFSPGQLKRVEAVTERFRPGLIPAQ